MLQQKEEKKKRTKIKRGGVEKKDEKESKVHWRRAKAKNKTQKVEAAEQALRGIEIATANVFE